MRPWGGVGAGPTHFLMEDGRLFRLSSRGGREGGFELRSWEVSGAYWTARATARGWRMMRSVAGSELRGDVPLLLLFAAEILEMEERMDVLKPSGKNDRKKARVKGKRTDARRA